MFNTKKGARKILCKQYMTNFNKAKIAGINLIYYVSNSIDLRTKRTVFRHRPFNFVSLFRNSFIMHT